MITCIYSINTLKGKKQAKTRNPTNNNKQVIKAEILSKILQVTLLYQQTNKQKKKKNLVCKSSNVK